MKNNSKAYFLIIAAVIIWSLSGLLVKAVNVDPLWISLIRCLGGGIFIAYIFKEKIYPIKNILFGGIFIGNIFTVPYNNYKNFKLSHGYIDAIYSSYVCNRLWFL